MDQNYSETIKYYDENAKGFVEQTIDADLTALHNQFLADLPCPARILDAGSGSGRDTRAFRQLGHEVVAIDASEEMVKATRHTAGEPVVHSEFIKYACDDLFDGVWACASLLHVPRKQLSQTLTHLSGLMKDGGRMFVSFKIGSTEEVRHGRFFNDLDEDQLEGILVDVPTLKAASMWITNDARPDRNDQWLNAILLKV
ncbi:class I SAM-dependent methyltransferase [Tateyamaria pelophila]|uniref:class I SAM-dependent methyltransferase n=1 Tax=Tateyamaria pelophila TaxID=328415 RepID=UPI001CBB79EF|nr:class I SAM-dependent methyltransferase [Tateyamaria pelophila]